MGYLKNELSKKNKYHLSKHRYLELKHFCLQYPEWKEQLRAINDICAVDLTRVKSTDLSREPERIAVERERLTKKIALVEQVVHMAGNDIYKWLLLGVTQEKSYVYLSSVMDIPCCKDVYYDRYRKVYWLLAQDLQSL